MKAGYGHGTGHQHKAPSIHIEAVVVCVDYADFLAWTLPLNQRQFDDLIVVTSTADLATQKLCDHYHVRCVTTDVFFANGLAFNKAAGINVGMQHMSRRGWMVHLDADILLPPRTKELIERSYPNEDFIYGIDRMDIPSFEDHVKFMCDPEAQYKGQAYVQANAHDMGSRLVVEDGYLPIGFFQLWHPVTSGVHKYCEQHDAENNHSDANHARQWPRNKRGFIPEIIGAHLSSEIVELGQNWRGRKSKYFGPK